MSGARDRQEQVAEGGRCSVTKLVVDAVRVNRGCPTGSNTGFRRLHHAGKLSGVDTPSEARKIAMRGVKPRRLARLVPVSDLLYAACPATASVSHNPAAFTERFVQPEMFPGARSFRVLKHATESANGVQSCCKTAVVIAKHLTNAGSCNDERRAHPHVAPALTGRMGDNGIRTRILAGVTRLVPRINIGQAEIAPTRLDVEPGNPPPISRPPGGGHASPGADGSGIQ